jgi:transposase InsO family protein
VRVLTRVLEVSASDFYDWVDRSPSKRARENARLEIEIKAAHSRTRQTYGSLRLRQELRAHGIEAGICRLRRLRQKLGLRCKQKRRFKVTTHSQHSLPVAANLLHQNFRAERPNQAWVCDITYIPTAEGWLYLAGHKDLFTGEIVGYAMGERLSKYLVSQSLLKALELKQPGAGLIQHSDQGSQYCAHEYQQLLTGRGIQASMSRRGNCYDNAPMESFWGTLKQELVHHRHYYTRREAMAEIVEYIEIFYNRQRIQAKLGFLSPSQFARLYQSQQWAKEGAFRVRY